MADEGRDGKYSATGLVVGALAATMLVPHAHAQRVEVGGIMEVVMTAHEEGGFGAGGRITVPRGGALGIEAQMTIGMGLGDGDDGDILGTVGVRVLKKFGPAGAFVTVRTGFLKCADDCALTDRPGTSGVVYAGGGIKLGGGHVFFRADVGAHAVRRKGKPTLGIGLGVQF